ncbi:SOSS complex subunit C-like isoform X1 [Ruditapes philippinarum]|uniref:SOSS complex subunit C-like isoform X1 n=1 Tax=Ruditapes philippinarum TaxID=129788 RepID=UPI00295BFB53|nr:SOSS complex subunit C-like isoform X1 [Ruditapes philippinarum]
MAFQPPNTGQERQNRKILEQLEEQKKRLRMQTQPGVPPSTVSSPSIATSPVIPPIPAQQPATAGVPPMVHPDTQAMSPAQRAALQHANANSVGYFITQDSSFGNLILPVLPRFDGART